MADGSRLPLAPVAQTRIDQSALLAYLLQHDAPAHLTSSLTHAMAMLDPPHTPHPPYFQTFPFLSHTPNPASHRFIQDGSFLTRSMSYSPLQKIEDHIVLWRLTSSQHFTNLPLTFSMCIIWVILSMCILNLELDLAQDRFRITTTWSVAFKKTTRRQLQHQHLSLIRRWEHCGRASYFAYTIAMNFPLHRLRHTYSWMSTISKQAIDWKTPVQLPQSVCNEWQSLVDFIDTDPWQPIWHPPALETDVPVLIHDASNQAVGGLFTTDGTSANHITLTWPQASSQHTVWTTIVRRGSTGRLPSTPDLSTLATLLLTPTHIPAPTPTPTTPLPTTSDYTPPPPPQPTP
eukprot:gene1652-2866_t